MSSKTCSITSDPSCFETQIEMNKKPVLPTKDDTVPTKNDCKPARCINVKGLSPEQIANISVNSYGPPELTAAAMYAMNRINKDKCTDTETLAKYATKTPANEQSCGGSKTCPAGQVCKDNMCYISPFEWVETPTSTMWRCPNGVEDCNAGVCRIVDDNFCLNYSQLPWTAVYKEGQTPEFVSLPQKVPCEKSEDCANIHGYVKGGQCVTAATGENMCSPVMPYLEWHPSLPWTEDDVCGPTGNAGKNKKSGKASNCGRCVFGNHSLRKFCEFPITRRSEPTHGATDVPPFCYNQSDGSCRMTPSYCKWEGISYKDDGSDETNKVVEESKQFACNRKNAKCYVPKGQQWGEFVLGKTMFRDKQKLLEGLIATAGLLSGGTIDIAMAAGADYAIEKTGFLKNNRSQYFSPAYDKNYFKEDFEQLPVINTEKAKETISKNYVENLINQVKKGLQKSPNTIKKLIDDKYMESKNIISKNIAGEGINIYAIEWNDKINDTSSIGNMGFIASELKTKYPHLVKEIDGDQYLIMNKKDITNKDLKRLYFFANSSKWLNKTLLELHLSKFGK